MLAAPVMLCAAANVATIIVTCSSEIILFMACLISEFDVKIVAAVLKNDGHRRSLLHRADASGLSGAARLSGSSVCAVASTVSRQYIREGIVETFSFGVYAVAKSQSVLRRIHEDAFESAKRDVKYIVDRSASVGVAGIIAGDESQPQLSVYRSRGNASVKPQEISDRSSILSRATGANGRLVLHQKQQVRARVGWNWNPQGT
jgi:hypothetical protein